MKIYKIASGRTLHHVTFTDKVPQIQKEGLKPFQTTNWKTGFGDRYGEGEIYAFENMIDAVRWAAKMDWDFHEDLGTGKISIVKFAEGLDWEIDENDPISQSGREGDWLKRMHAVRPDEILDVVTVTPEMIKTLVNH